jgi:plasmid replication initiation protein
MDNQNNLQKAKTSNLIEFQPSKMLNIPSSAIHIQNDISLIQKKLWFELVYQALPSMGSRERYTISLKRLRELLGWSESTSSDDRLKEALHGLNSTAIKWNIFGKDKKRVWESFPMLGGCQIPENSGICIFEFSSFLEERFLSMGQEAYVKIDLIISKKFQSKYALSIYCLALDYLIIERGYSEKKFSIEELRKYLGVKEDEYKLTANFNDRIINPSEEEINTNSDINIEIKPYKEGRKIAGYKFCISLKEGRLRDYLEKKNKLNENTIPQIENKQTGIFEQKNISLRSEAKEVEIVKTQVIKPEVPKREVIKVENEELKKFFAEYKISITTNTIQDKFREAKEIFKDRFEDYLVFLMIYTKQELKRISITNISGFYVSLLRDDNQIDNYIVEMQNKEKEKEKNREKINYLIQHELKKKYNDYLSKDFDVYLISNIEKLESKIIKVLKEAKESEFVFGFIRNKEIDKELILTSNIGVKVVVKNYLRENQDKLDYKALTFEEWKVKEVTEEEIKEIEKNLI